MTEQEDFLTLVENGVERVYPEKSIEDSHRIYVPIILGSAIGLVSEVIILITLESLANEFTFMFMIMPILIGVLLTIVAGMSVIRNEKRYGVRGINRKMLSKAIHFLDMVHQGHADIGRVTDSPRPDELLATMTFGFGSAVYALKRIDPDLAKIWMSTLKEKLKPETSSKEIWFIRITIYGMLAAIPILLIAAVLHVIGVLNEEVFMYVVVVMVIAIILLASIMLLRVITTYKAEAPQGVVDALSEPQLRMDTETALDKIIQTVREEGQHPLRVLVLGRYDDLIYTERIYKTSKDYELKAAAIFPVHDHSLSGNQN
ncbi:MAG: hypothetical protein RTV31_03845 [Candidatus Thorarchaeota archaeon]